MISMEIHMLHLSLRFAHITAIATTITTTTKTDDYYRDKQIKSELISEKERVTHGFLFTLYNPIVYT